MEVTGAINDDRPTPHPQLCQGIGSSALASRKAGQLRLQRPRKILAPPHPVK